VGNFVCAPPDRNYVSVSTRKLAHSAPQRIKEVISKCILHVVKLLVFCACSAAVFLNCLYVSHLGLLLLSQ